MRSFLTAHGTELRLTQTVLPPFTDDMGPACFALDRPRAHLPDHGRVWWRLHRGRRPQLAAAERTAARRGAESLLRSGRRARLYLLPGAHEQLRFFAHGNYAHAATPGDTDLARFQHRARRAGAAAVHPGGAERGTLADQATGLTLESTSLDEEQRTDEPRWSFVARIPRCLGALLRALHSGVRAARRADLGCLGAERTDGGAAMGLLHLQCRGRARLRARPPRVRSWKRRASAT